MEETEISGQKMSRRLCWEAWIKSSQCAVYGATYCVLRCSQILGVAPLRFHKEQKEWRIEVSNKQVVAHSVYEIFATLAFFVSLFFYPFNDFMRELPRIILYLRYAVIFFNVTAALVAVIGAKPRLKKIIHCLTTVHKIRKALSGKDSQLSTYKAKMAELAAFYVLSTCRACLVFILEDTEVSKGDKISYYIYSVYVEYNMCKIIGTTMQFIQMTGEVRSALSLLNDRLNLIHLSYKSSIELKRISHEDQETIKKINEIYYLFPQMVKLLDNCFGVGVLLLSGICFLYIVVASYCLIIATADDVLVVVSLITTVFFGILMLIRMMETYHGLFRECMRTRSEVGQLLSCSHHCVAEQLEKLQLCLRLSDVTVSTTKLGSLSRVSILQKSSNVAAYILMIASFRDFDKTNQQ